MIRPLFVLLSFVLPLSAFELPKDSMQCVTGTAKGWNSSTVTLNAYERRGGRWVKTSGPWQGRLGRDGLVWGLGQRVRDVTQGPEGYIYLAVEPKDGSILRLGPAA